MACAIFHFFIKLKQSTMKKILTYLMMVVFSIIISTTVKSQEVTNSNTPICVSQSMNKDSIWFMEKIINPDTLGISDPSLRRLVFALIYVESRGIDTIYNKSRTCVGSLQETKTLVDDVNRILKIWKINRSYKYSDRKNRIKSVEMFMIFVKYYHKKKKNWETIAKSWNQGMAGMYIYKDRAQKYWNLTKKALINVK